MGIEKLIGKLVLAVIFGIILASALPSSFAQEITSLTTDSPAYSTGQMIFVTGEVNEIIPEAQATITIFHEGNLVDIAQVPVSQDGKFFHIFSANWQEAGTYIVRGLYGTSTIETSFEFFLDDQSLQEQIDGLVFVIGQLFDTMISGFELLGLAIANLQTQADDQETRISDLEIAPMQIYEVSLTVQIGISDDVPKPFSLRCLEGDSMYVSNSINESLESVAVPEAAGGGFGDLSFLKDGNKIVGVEGLAVGTLQLFEYEITATILCLSPSS